MRAGGCGQRLCRQRGREEKIARARVSVFYIMAVSRDLRRLCIGSRSHATKWRRLEVLYTFLSRGEGNARL